MHLFYKSWRVLTNFRHDCLGKQLFSNNEKTPCHKINFITVLVCKKQYLETCSLIYNFIAASQFHFLNYKCSGIISADEEV